MRRRSTAIEGTWLPLLLALLSGCARGHSEGAAASSSQPLRHVGRGVCAECHQEQIRQWAGSHHDLAMQPATDETVLADFDNATFTYGSVTTTFFRRGVRFWVRTDNAAGELEDFEVAYTFGASPLQQYLLKTEGGRLQALSICWDTRSAEAGGQRWFHLYPDEEIDHHDPLHWTGRYQNWNFMCAECHSTAVDRGYDPASDSYATTWEELDVSCEACHGPGSRHVAWARAPTDGDSADRGPTEVATGLVVALGDDDDGVWRFASAVGDDTGGTVPNASRSAPRREHREVQACARCHSRRSTIHQSYQHGRPLLDSYRPATLDAQLYFADGQILDEVYVYGSFLQSRMFQQGVTCKDCHDPHSLELKGTTESVCAQCHAGAVYDTPEHHHHPPASAGARCVECHMAARTYMEVDPRRDHSFRVPRPDLSREIGIPNACNSCHVEREAEWAATTVAAWFPAGRSGSAHYGEALHAGRTVAADAENRLQAAAQDRELPSLVRATALGELARYLSPFSLPAVELALADSDPLVRLGALAALEGTDAATRLRLAFPQLEDGIRAVRLEAARILGPIPAETLAPDQRPRLEIALDEYRAAQLVNADRADAHLNLGALAAVRGDLESARQSYATALRLEPSFVPAAINLADLERQQGRDAEGAATLREALARSPQDPRLHHAFGLALIRQGLREEALDSLAQASELAADEPRYAYVYGVALYDLGESGRAMKVLDAAHQRHPGDRDTLAALVAYSRSEGDRAGTLHYALSLLELVPGDRELKQLVEELDG